MNSGIGVCILYNVKKFNAKSIDKNEHQRFGPPISWSLAMYSVK
jgi:hypothetical protein